MLNCSSSPSSDGGDFRPILPGDTSLSSSSLSSLFSSCSMECPVSPYIQFRPASSTTSNTSSKDDLGYGPPRYPDILPDEEISGPQGWRFSEKSKKGDLKLWSRVVSSEDEKALFHFCLEIKDSLTPEVVNGHETRRKSIGFGDPGYEYEYKGAIRKAEPWPTWLLKIRNTLEERFEQQFTFALLNYFPDQSGINAHNDAERAMKERSIIACLSVGYTHILTIQRFNHEVIQNVEIPSGSMYTMEGQFQEFLLHGVKPKPLGNEKMSEEQLCRFSITFRHLVLPHNINDKPQTKKKLGKRRGNPSNSSNRTKHQKKLTEASRRKSGLVLVKKSGPSQ
jgi:alkylated DNA repair dioxygenase AlkB